VPVLRCSRRAPSLRKIVTLALEEGTFEKDDCIVGCLSIANCLDVGVIYLVLSS